MHVLYALASSRATDPNADNIDNRMVSALVELGHTIQVSVYGPAGVEVQFEGLTAYPGVTLAVVGGSPARDDFSDIGELEGAPSLVIVRGLGLNSALNTSEGNVTSVWSILTDADVSELENTSGVDRETVLPLLERNANTLVESDVSLQRVRRVAPGSAHKMASLNEIGSAADYWLGLARLINRHLAERRVVLYRAPEMANLQDWSATTAKGAERLASQDIHIILMCHKAKSLFENTGLINSPFISIVEPIVAKHQIENDALMGRYAAWHAYKVVDELRGTIVITDDLETVRYALTNSRLRDCMWPVVTFQDLDGFNTQAEDVSRLAKAVHRVVVTNEDSQSVLESRVPELTSKTALLSGLWQDDQLTRNSERDTTGADQLRRQLERSTANYQVTPELLVPRRVVLVGHDFKFTGELIDTLTQRRDVDLRVDHWELQTRQDKEKSRHLIEWADTVFCEFSTHNAVWYSWEKRAGQSLIVRFHGYELYTPAIHDINVANVDMFVFVSEFYRDKVVGELGWPKEKTCVIPNMVDGTDLFRSKIDDARFHLGIAGIVPSLKRPDRALDLLEQLIAVDDRYTLHVRGRFPWEYGWMWRDDAVRDAYSALYERLASDPHLRSHVSFDGFGADMGVWFRKIGWTLSPSFRETFHLAPVEGMASGAVPLVWAREGVTEIFGDDWVQEDTESLTQYVLGINEDVNRFDRLSEAATHRSRQYDVVTNKAKWLRVLFDTEGRLADNPDERIAASRLEGQFLENPNSEILARLISLLNRDGDEERIGTLLNEYPLITDRLPKRLLFARAWAEGVEVLKNGLLPIGARSAGPAYLVDSSRVLYSTHCVECESDDVMDGQDSSSFATVRTIHIASEAFPPIDCDAPSKVLDGAVQPMSADEIRLSNTGGLRVDRLIHAAADAVVREARRYRPSVIAASGEFWVTLPALMAARRLGVPFVIRRPNAVNPFGDGVLSDAVGNESDGLFRKEEDLQKSIALAWDYYKKNTIEVGHHLLSDITVGVIADQFTAQTIAHSFSTVPLSRKDGFSQVASLPLDVIFIESAWEGPNYEWRRGVAYYDKEIDDLARIIEVARARNIPVLMWNKEDPVHFRAFERTAAMMDYIFTTDADMVGKYLDNPTRVVLSAASMPFYAEPVIHNPLPTNRMYEHSVSYAGTYYGERFKERSLELHRILDVAKEYGLTIYDRQVSVPNSPYQFPPELADFVREGVPYAEVLEVYKAHPVNINVNSANSSPTMFSRRVVEVAASGSVVLSGKGRGINEQLGGIEAGDSEYRWKELLESWMNSEPERIAEAWKQMRTITRSHLAAHSMTIMLRTAGLKVRAPLLPSYAVVVDRLDDSVLRQLLLQTWLPVSVYCLNLSASQVEVLESYGILAVRASAPREGQVDWQTSGGNIPSASYFEDLLHATRFGEWDLLGGRPVNDDDGHGTPLVELSRSGSYAELHKVRSAEGVSPKPLTWVMPADSV